MALFAVLVVALLIIGVVALALVPRRQRRDDLDVTERAVRPPADPEAPLPGSATRRRAQGQP